MKTVNKLSDDELIELDALRAAAGGKCVLDGSEVIDFTLRAGQQWGRILAEIQHSREVTERTTSLLSMVRCYWSQARQRRFATEFIELHDSFIRDLDRLTQSLKGGGE